MQSSSRLLTAAFLASLAVLGSAPRGASAASHLWRIHEVFSNADGTVQYIVLHECCGSAKELFLKNLELESKTTGHVYTFPRDLTGSSAQKYLLLATQGYADIPDMPPPDFILADSFFAPTGDKLWYSEARNYDSYTFKAGDLPVDGLHALRVTNYTTDASTIVENAPVNYAGASGHMDLSVRHDFIRGDCNADGSSQVSDAIFMLQVLFRSEGDFGCQDACETNGDGELDISDAVHLIVYLFAAGPPLPEPSTCGPDPSGDGLGCQSYAACP